MQKSSRLPEREVTIVASLAIITAVATMLYSAFARKPRSVYRDPCTSNMKQMGTAAAIYCSDSNDRMPLENWMEGLFVYTRNREAMECPEIVKAEKHYGYAMKIGMIGLNIHTIAEPQATAVFFETDALGKSIVANLAARSGRHKGGSLVGYMDSHAKFVRLGDPVK